RRPRRPRRAWRGVASPGDSWLLPGGWSHTVPDFERVSKVAGGYGLPDRMRPDQVIGVSITPIRSDSVPTRLEQPPCGKRLTRLGPMRVQHTHRSTHYRQGQYVLRFMVR